MIGSVSASTSPVGTHSDGGNMQFYLNGYAPGDPDLRKEKLPDTVDVLVIGC